MHRRPLLHAYLYHGYGSPRARRPTGSEPRTRPLTPTLPLHDVSWHSARGSSRLSHSPSAATARLRCPLLSVAPLCVVAPARHSGTVFGHTRKSFVSRLSSLREGTKTTKTASITGLFFSDRARCCLAQEWPLSLFSRANILAHQRRCLLCTPAFFLRLTRTVAPSGGAAAKRFPGSHARSLSHLGIAR